MKAVVSTEYGPPEMLQIKDIAKPVPGENQVLIKVHATAINDYDWSMIRGKPYLYRLMFGLFKPKNRVPGMELAGTVESLGKNASKFHVGEAVYGDISEYGFGSFAEYICINQQALIRKPHEMTFQQAAAIPHASLLAFQGLTDIGKIESGQKILINGAGGGMGTFGLQIAKLYHAEVTGVDSGEKLSLMKSLGFDHVIDYKKVDFTSNGQRYDLILDAKTNRAPRSYLSSLKPSGQYVSVGGSPSRLLQLLMYKWWARKFTGKGLHILALKPNKGLDLINELFNDGKINPVIDGPYSLEEIPKVIQYFGEGKHVGKVVILV